MIINNNSYNINNLSISYEFGFSLRNVNKQTYSIDYGISTDHIHASFTIDGNLSDIISLHNYLQPKLGTQITVSDSLNIFGPCYTSSSFAPFLTALEAPVTVEKGLSSIAIKLSDKPSTMAKMPSQSLDLQRLALSSIGRNFNESINIQSKMIGYTSANHGWERPSLMMSIKGKADVIGSNFSWLTTQREAFSLVCNSSINLINTNQTNVLITSISLTPVDNSGWWSMSLDGVKI